MVLLSGTPGGAEVKPEYHEDDRKNPLDNQDDVLLLQIGPPDHHVGEESEGKEGRQDRQDPRHKQRV